MKNVLRCSIISLKPALYYIYNNNDTLCKSEKDVCNKNNYFL